jgi:putative transposase
MAIPSCPYSNCELFVATATFRILYTLIVLDHDRRKILHFRVTENPTQVWLSHQMTDAFPWDDSPRYLLRDRDASYGPVFRTRVKGMGVEEVVIAPLHLLKNSKTVNRRE